MDGNYFKGNHEIKFGFTWRKATTSSTSTYGQDYISDDNAQGYPVVNAGYPFMGVQVVAPYATDGVVEVHQLLRRRHDLAEADDDQRRHALRPPGRHRAASRS